MWIFWLIFSFLLATFIIFSAFPMVMMLKAAENAGVRIPRGIRIVGKLWYLVGGPSDVIFNTIPAWLIFDKVEFVGATFSQRIQVYVDMIVVGGDAEVDPDVVWMWVAFLNFCDPGHIKVPNK